MRIVPPGEGEVVGDSPARRVEILSDDPAVHVTVTRFGPGRDGADLHVHHRHSDLFFVLEGELTVRLGLQDEQRTVPAGSLVRIPPGVVHGFRNASGVDLRYLNLHAPGCAFATYMRGLRDGVKVAYDQHDPPADGGRAISEAEFTSGDGVLADAEAVRVERVDGTLHGPAGGYVLEGEAAGTWVAVPAGESYRADGRLLAVTGRSSRA